VRHEPTSAPAWGRNAGVSSPDEPDQLALARPPSPRRRPRRTSEPAADERPVARVLVDVPLPHLDRPFDYVVPASMAAAAVPGVRVAVQFSGQNVAGFVLDRVEQSEHEGRLARLRRVVSAEPVLAPEIARLARAVADRYAGTVADVLRLAVPPRHAAAEREAPAPSDDGEPEQSRPADVAVPEPAGWGDHVDGGALFAALSSGGAPRAVWQPGPAAGWPDLLARLTAATLAGRRGALVVLPDARDVARVDHALTRLVGAGRHVVLEADLGPAERYRRWLAVRRGAGRGPSRRRGLTCDAWLPAFESRAMTTSVAGTTPPGLRGCRPWPGGRHDPGSSADRSWSRCRGRATYLRSCAADAAPRRAACPARDRSAWVVLPAHRPAVGAVRWRPGGPAVSVVARRCGVPCSALVARPRSSAGPFRAYPSGCPVAKRCSPMCPPTRHSWWRRPEPSPSHRTATQRRCWSTVTPCFHARACAHPRRRCGAGWGRRRWFARAPQVATWWWSPTLRLQPSRRWSAGIRRASRPVSWRTAPRWGSLQLLAPSSSPVRNPTWPICCV